MFSRQYVVAVVSALRDEIEASLGDPPLTEDAWNWIDAARHLDQAVSSISRTGPILTREVWKFALPVLSDTVVVPMPAGSEVVHVGVKAGVLCLWALVHYLGSKVDRKFTVCGSGHPISGALTYLGSAVDGARGLVWHVFEDRSQP